VNQQFRLDNKVGVVTGACGKLGPVWVEALLDAGATVAALELRAKASDVYDALAGRFGARLRRFDCDIIDRRSIESAAGALIAEMGVPSVLVNNAGIDQPPDSVSSRWRIEELPADQFRKMVEVNLLGTFQVTQVLGGRMADGGGGSIINIGSLYASVSPDQRFYDHLPGEPPFLKSPAYGASKAAVVNMTKYFATLWGKQGVRVNTLSPGGVEADQHLEFKTKYGARVPLGRMATASDLSGPLLFVG
jgi:NAD(P)-dependent dehydrogenase (short-subunit alcohol dehydrogenase family)